MPLFFAWIIIIVVILLLLILLRKFIKRLLFLIVLMAVAFFMYGLFSPSGASKLRDSVRTFPQWVASFLGGEEVEQSVIEQPVIEQPVIQQPVIEQPVVQQPSDTEQSEKKSDKKAEEKAETFGSKYPIRSLSLGFIKEKFPVQEEVSPLPVEIVEEYEE